MLVWLLGLETGWWSGFGVEVEKNRTRALTLELIGEGDGSDKKALMLIDVRVELRLMQLWKLW